MGERTHEDILRPSGSQRRGTLSRSSPGRHDVVHESDTEAFHTCPITDTERTAHILGALLSGTQPRLGQCPAMPFK